jgi:hypothetical protein
MQAHACGDRTDAEHGGGLGDGELVEGDEFETARSPLGSRATAANSSRARAAASIRAVARRSRPARRCSAAMTWRAMPNSQARGTPRSGW